MKNSLVKQCVRDKDKHRAQAYSESHRTWKFTVVESVLLKANLVGSSEDDTSVKFFWLSLQTRRASWPWHFYSLMRPRIKLLVNSIVLHIEIIPETILTIVLIIILFLWLYCLTEHTERKLSSAGTSKLWPTNQIQSSMTFHLACSLNPGQQR